MKKVGVSLKAMGTAGQGQGQQRNVVIGKTKERHGWVVCSYYEVWGK